MAWHRRDDRREDDDRGNLYNYVSIVKSRAHAFSDVAEEEYIVMWPRVTRIPVKCIDGGLKWTKAFNVWCLTLCSLSLINHSKRVNFFYMQSIICDRPLTSHPVKVNL